ncbi:hypothetical protein SynA1528_01886 [Synechococcus sp. A15-28]|nr:hypothetical protein SynA1528_01886 [Synechococcus sp. A15-28]
MVIQRPSQEEMDSFNIRRCAVAVFHQQTKDLNVRCRHDSRISIV